MADHKSEIDEAVLAFHQNTQHVFETITVEGVLLTFCTRCGKPAAEVVIDKEVQPCRGFI